MDTDVWMDVPIGEDDDDDCNRESDVDDPDEFTPTGAGQTYDVLEDDILGAHYTRKARIRYLSELFLSR